MTPDQALTAINGALTGPERHKIAAGFGRVNPHLCDLNADDVLELLYQSDAHLDLLEPFWKANPDLGRAEPSAGWFAALAVIRLGWPLTRRSVAVLLHRAGLLRTLGRADIAELAAAQRQQAEDKQGMAMMAGDIGAAELAQALHDLAREEEKLAAKLEALAATMHDPPATS